MAAHPTRGTPANRSKKLTQKKKSPGDRGSRSSRPNRDVLATGSRKDRDPAARLLLARDRELLVDLLGKLLVRDRAALNLLAVQEQRRRAGDADPGSQIDFLGHLGRHLAAVEAAVELLGVQAGPRRLVLEVGDLELLLLLEQQVVHLPELPLVLGAERRFRSLLRERVDLVQRVLVEHDLHLVG